MGYNVQGLIVYSPFLVAWHTQLSFLQPEKHVNLNIFLSQEHFFSKFVKCHKKRMISYIQKQYIDWWLSSGFVSRHLLKIQSGRHKQRSGQHFPAKKKKIS
jgi:hypothetical protein